MAILEKCLLGKGDKHTHAIVYDLHQKKGEEGARKRYEVHCKT